jgi:hypothetical protein
LFDGLVVQLLGLGTSESLQELELNFALSMVQGIKPRDEVEAMLAAQMCAVHLATMRAAHSLAKCETIPQRDSATNAFNKLSRTFTAQLEALKREQCIRVQHQHVNVHDGAQAVITSTLQAGVGGHEKKS